MIAPSTASGLQRPVTQAMPRSPFSGDPQPNGGHRNIPILPSNKSLESNHGEPMDISPPPSATMGPPINSSPEMEHNGGMSNGAYGDAVHQNGSNGSMTNGLSAAAATSSQQPKVVQTAFIHKLYNMLEDDSIQTLISWSSNNESFVMSPSTDFSKVLAQYFKHTNISSFVRQLNMYGFHKVSDVFHTGSPESTLWEFKHGNNNFKRGDLAGLREIKRRASRHALIHRDSFSSPHKPSVSQPGTPAEPLPDVGDVRLATLEHNLYDLHARLMRTEENNTALSSKCQALNDSLIKCHQWTMDMSHFITSMIPDQETHIRRDISLMQKDVARQMDMVRNYEDPHESLLSGRQPYFSNMALDPTPLSPRQASQDDRRGSLHAMPSRPILRPPAAPHFSNAPRRYGSIGTGNPSPNFHRPMQQGPPPINPPPPSQQHPLASVTSPEGPNLVRRHTAADIRVPGWAPAPAVSPNTSGHSSGHWPSSPHQAPSAADQQVRDVLAQYELGAPRQPYNPSNHTTPPLTNDATPSTLSVESSWSLGGPKFPSRHLDSAPQTRRSSTASNLHSLLNPAETVERDEDDVLGDDRKRKRMM